MELRRRRLASQYSLKISSNMNNPARNCAFDKWFTKPFDKCLNQICPSGLHVKTYLSAIGFKQKDIFISSTSTVSPWLHTRPSVNLSLCNFAKSETNPDVFKCKFLEICDDLGVFLSDIRRWIQNEQRHSSSSREWQCGQELANHSRTCNS